MNIRKSSLPVFNSDRVLLPKSNESSPIKSLWLQAKKRLVSSCSKINNEDIYHLTIPKCHSFPGHSSDAERNCDNCDISGSRCSTEKSNSTPSIADTLSKVRRLTHVYDHDEILIPHLMPGFVSSEERVLVATVAVSEPIHDEVTPDEEKPPIEQVLVQNPTRIGDKTYKLPTKAAAILGADDRLVFQSINDCPSTAVKIQHALFLDTKSNENKVRKWL